MRIFRALARVITALCERAAALAVGVSLATVSAATGFISYTHISALTQDFWQNWKTAHLMPLAVDGQIVIGSVYFMEHSGERKRWLGLIGVVPGILESLYSNWQSVTPPPGTPWIVSVEAHLWATVPAQAFACSTILFERWLHRRRELRPVSAAQPHGGLMSLLGWPPAVLATATSVPAAVPAAVPPAPGLPLVHPAPAGTPWGLVTPAESPQQAPALPQFPQVPVLGPHSPLAARPKRAPAARFAGHDPARPEDTRLPLPEGDELERAVATMARNELVRTYQISKYKADQLRELFGVGQPASEEAARDAA